MSNERSNESPWCNPCQSYHPVSQPCFDAATAARLRHPRFSVSGSECRCGECGHAAWFSVNNSGICAHARADDDPTTCGCKCVFPATGAGEGEQRDPIADMLLPIIYKVAKEPCRNYARGCSEKQPDHSYWCAPCEAREALEAVEANPAIVAAYCLGPVPVADGEPDLKQNQT